MPELPEVEVTRLGIAPHLQGRSISAVKVLDGRLRWPVPKTLSKILPGQKVRGIERRGKYLLIELDTGYVLVHLGMTGTLRVLPSTEPLKLHDRVTLEFGKLSLRLHDPRKFGAVLWHPKTKGPIEKNALLQKLGVEPFSPEFAGELGADILYKTSRKRSIAVKQFLLAGQSVVGVGNIYCSESLFEAGINPAKAAGKLTRPQCSRLAEAVRLILKKAIAAGGSTLKDFVNSDGDPGHFMVQTKVYDRKDQPCKICKTPIKQIVQGQRSTYFCPTCQKR
ncbi:DNA-formamidopyrimidine glycosylase [Polynucleobacter wuianus]|uniref:Formamidopyrimidine-DNA glycosylase n=1 Tax=Polynucleobacter wuianus TaxID=1743168 RepID=A0A191UHP0_9BURK|nr:MULTISPECIES: bifunctional DNA-formamidopyrimidine glycosylase/DNA-(apurinic or apyrimidinic site) lyase [Polynucleobacter]ANJ00503.1 DNA-formamidopyrimidine glycosylase [Polynucleobacter wuianus]MBU3553090.1 bifunctional DNA-formamidopyrimidine glycosylase/DNA-(apurinic or apyrimidinic site) lyase [Polynucleobacter sp. MWH-Post4-6-1]MBU3609767.1 bifunctional DNA-formamidopyrimidine glycosylase/DNA-(apurinic or apyrimidinic site) lyase [Polynucleobacter wuianus]